MISSENPHPLFSLFSVLSLVTIFSVESKELELELEQPKKKSPSLHLSKNSENTYRKNSIKKVNCHPRCVT